MSDTRYIEVLSGEYKGCRGYIIESYGFHRSVRVVLYDGVKPIRVALLSKDVQVIDTAEVLYANC